MALRQIRAEPPSLVRKGAEYHSEVNCKEFHLKLTKIGDLGGKLLQAAVARQPQAAQKKIIPAIPPSSLLSVPLFP
jgi:hypothetical protein